MSHRVTHIAEQRDRRFHKRVNKAGLRFRNHLHVAFMNRLPAGHRRSIKRKTVLEAFLSQLTDGNREVPQRTAEVRKSQIDRLNLSLATQRQNLARRHIALGHVPKPLQL